MKRNGARLSLATAALLSLLAFAPGCAPKTESRTAEEKKFLAPTNLNKLTPEARAHLSRMKKAPAAKP